MPEPPVTAPEQLGQLLSAALHESEDRIAEQLDATRAQLPDPRHQFDALERASDDVTDPAVRREVRELLTQLEEIHLETTHIVQDLRLFECLDPVRVIATDMTHGFL